MPASSSLQADLKKHLFNIATSPRKIHRLPSVTLPQFANEPIPSAKLFRDENHTHILELGSGWGEFAAEWMRENPDHDYVAFEIKPDRIRQMLKSAKENIAAIRVVPINYSWFLESILPARSFDRIIINFPDPWPKKRHHKHRLVKEGFDRRMATLLRAGGTLHLATDYAPYARRMIALMRRSNLFEPMMEWPNYTRSRPEKFPKTKFEQMQTTLGFSPFYLQWRLKNE